MANVYEMVTERIIELLDKGIIPWRKGWTAGSAAAINYCTRKAYRGVNAMLLPFAGEYLTFKQCEAAGGHIKKGEKGNLIVFYKVYEKATPTQDDPNHVDKIPVLKYSYVFHISQCEGIESKLQPEAETPDKNSTLEAGEAVVENYIAASGVKLNKLPQDRAFYSPATDSITVPTLQQFDSSEEYYSTLFHEMTHSTGHASRLNRLNSLAAFGSEDYSKEELIAEIGSSFLMNKAGLEIPATFKNSVAYIQAWRNKLSEDKCLIVRAASAAEKAVNLILGEVN